MKQKILITGASGFIGSFLVETALSRGLEVWAAVRASSSKRYLASPGINFVTLTLTDAAALERELRQWQSEHGRWDYVVHAAGATKARDEAGFMKVNLDATRNLVGLLCQLDMKPDRMVYLSSLSILGAIREEPSAEAAPFVYPMMEAGDTPMPNTAYGRSKLAAERYLATTGLDYVVLRPTGVYGPREKDYFLMAKSIRQHLDFSVGYKPQEITFVYVKDLCNAVFIAMERGERGACYLVSDDRTYSSAAFSQLLQSEMGVRCVLHVKAPIALLRVVCALNDALSRVTGRMSALNNDKFQILKQRNWRCDISPLKALGYLPEYDLARGVRETVDWYKEQSWI